MNGLDACNLIYKHLNESKNRIAIQSQVHYCHWSLRENSTLIFSLSSDDSASAIEKIKAHPFDYMLTSMRPEEILQKIYKARFHGY